MMKVEKVDDSTLDDLFAVVTELEGSLLLAIDNLKIKEEVRVVGDAFFSCVRIMQSSIRYLLVQLSAK